MFSRRKRIIRAKGSDQKEIFDRQERLRGWSQEKIENATVGLIGAGGFGGVYARNLTRMGIGSLIICDSDFVEISNLSRQEFYRNQLGQSKALSLQKNLLRECSYSTRIKAIPLDFQDVPHEYRKADILACLVDNDKTRYDVSRYALKMKKLVLFSGVSEDMRVGYVFMQDNEGPCFNCLWPKAKDPKRNKCRYPGVNYIHTAVMGIAVYATVCKILNWEMPWNYFCFSMTSESIVIVREKDENCLVCRR
jgi:molybdopterin/thiamine biosynthesis adenylyltransferase